MRGIIVGGFGCLSGSPGFLGRRRRGNSGDLRVIVVGGFGRAWDLHGFLAGDGGEFLET